MELSNEIRLLLRNQYRLLRALEPDRKAECDEAIEALESGYEFEYEDLYSQFSTPMSTKDCREVRDVLEMYRQLGTSARLLGGVEGVAETDLAFRGFDGNEEARQLLYAEFLVDAKGLWAEFAEGADGLNSHWPMMPQYRAMLAVWRGCPSRTDAMRVSDSPLTAEEVRKIVAAS